MTPTAQNIYGSTKRIFEIGNFLLYEGAHLVKTSNLALLGILVQLVQKVNQNVSVKHTIRKINFIQNPTKILKQCCQKKILSDLVTKLVNISVFVIFCCCLNISSY